MRKLFPNKQIKYNYVLIVILPSLIFSFLILQMKYYQVVNHLTTKTEAIVTLHKNQLDRFIGETVASIEALALVVSSKEGKAEIKDILEKAHTKDSRFSGYSWANLNGDILISSIEMNGKTNIAHREYFQEVKKTKKSTISSAQFGLITQKCIVTIATPVMTPDENIREFLFASLRLDYIKTIMEDLAPDSTLRILDQNNNILFESKNDFDSIDSPIITAQLENAKWRVQGKANIHKISAKDILLRSILYIMLVLVLTHTIFLLTEYYLLKRQSKLERMENEVQKLELVGTLAASTAHEIKNPLTGIKGLVQLLSEKYKDPDDQFYFSVIQSEISRINNIVGEFLILGKPTAEHLDRFNIIDIIHKIEPIIQSEANFYNIELSLDLSETPIYIWCSKDNIKRLILNLSKNALESMEKTGGKLTIRIRHNQNECNIEVIDTGIGMSKQILDKLFTPFQTSKETGTGLGLVICKRIVNMYNGSISIDSEENVGTTVVVRLPISNEKK